MGKDRKTIEKTTNLSSENQNQEKMKTQYPFLTKNQKDPRKFLLSICAKPDAREDRIYQDGDLLCVDISTPPVKGKATTDIIKFMAKRLQISSSQITLISGGTSRDKKFEINAPDLTENQLIAKILDK